MKTHTHPFNGPFPGKVEPMWILLKQDTVSGSGISWDICKSATRSRQITMPAPHHSVFLQAGCPSCHPTNSVNQQRQRTEGSNHWRLNLHEKHNASQTASKSTHCQCLFSWVHLRAEGTAHNAAQQTSHTQARKCKKSNGRQKCFRQTLRFC